MRCPRCDTDTPAAPCAHCGARFDDGAPATRMVASAAGPSASDDDLLLGATTLGGYRLERTLLGGGMARVLLARRLADGARVVCKAPPDRRPASRLRFTREVRALASLDHPNVVRLLDIDAGLAGTPVMVLEHLDGPSWRDLLLDHQPSLATVERVIGDLARALDHCHRRGVIHRDVKPDNLLVRHGHGVLIDFGLALVDAPAPARPHHHIDTPEGALLGTPPYAAPEQLGDPSRVGPAADVYSLGVIVRESLAHCRDATAERQALWSRLGEHLCTPSPERRPPARVVLEFLRRLPPSGLAADPMLRARRARRLPWLVAGAGAAAGLLTVLALDPSGTTAEPRTFSGSMGSASVQTLTLQAEPGTQLQVEARGDTRIRLPGGGAWTDRSLRLAGSADGRVVIQVSDGDGRWELAVE